MIPRIVEILDAIATSRDPARMRELAREGLCMFARPVCSNDLGAWGRTRPAVEECEGCGDVAELSRVAGSRLCPGCKADHPETIERMRADDNEEG